MAEEKNKDQPDEEPTLVEQWFEDQLAWQKTMTSFLDSMTTNDEFLVHLGNAMRGSLLAGKPYPTTSSADPGTAESQADDRIDQILFALHRIEGQLNDFKLSFDELRASTSSKPTSKKRPRTAAKKKPPKQPRGGNA